MIIEQEDTNWHTVILPLRADQSRDRVEDSAGHA
jgi:hypothetical protein